METSSRHKQASIFNFHLAAVSVVNNKNQSQSGQITFTTEDYYAIRVRMLVLFDLYLFISSFPCRKFMMSLYFFASLCTHFVQQYMVMKL